MFQKWALEGYGVDVVLIRFRRGSPNEIRIMTCYNANASSLSTLCRQRGLDKPCPLCESDIGSCISEMKAISAVSALSAMRKGP